MKVQPLLSAESLVRRYGSGDALVTVLDSIDLEIAEGGFLAIVGRSGSGKSTLLNLLAGLERPDSGVVRYRGTDIATLTDTEASRLRRESFGFVFQSFNLIPTLTVRENLVLPMTLVGRGADSYGIVHDLLEDIGLAAVARRYPEELSGGEQQRVAIARAIVHSPQIVFADEPTGNLDLETARGTLDLLERCSTAVGRTLVMATHSPDVIGHADRVITISNGRLGEA